jgi:hypothetical protein
MRSPAFLLVLLLILMVTTAFVRHGSEPEAPMVQDLKPASELALLMRSMATHADSVKAAVQRKGKLPPYPKEIRTLLTATPTEGMHIDPITYPTFANDYVKKVDQLYKGSKKDHARLYNALVQGCANCHSTHCPGPMMRIKKMYVPL